MKLEQELIQRVKGWDQAMINNDVPEIARYMSDSWVGVGSNGITSKADFLGWIKSGALVHNRMDSDKMHIRMYGTTGIIVSRGTSAGTYNGEAFELYEWSTSVFVKERGDWQCVLTMLTDADKENI